MPLSNVDASAPARLTDGSRMGVVGGGPAGSFFSFFLLTTAERLGMKLEVDLYEYRDFGNPAPQGCNMCGGIISESLVQILAAEGINLPPSVIQRGIDSYVLHMDVGSVRIETPTHEKRIGAMHRGPGPSDVKTTRWEASTATSRAWPWTRERIRRERMDRITGYGDRPGIAQVRRGDQDLRSRGGRGRSQLLRPELLAETAIGYRAPRTTKTFIREYFLGKETINACWEFHARLPPQHSPAGVRRVHPQGGVRHRLPPGRRHRQRAGGPLHGRPGGEVGLPVDFPIEERSCQCSPRINVAGAIRPFADRILVIGDAGVTRLYKDGIGAAYRTAKAAATTAVLHGVSAAAFERHYWPTCRAILGDNRIGKLTFAVTRQIQRRRWPGGPSCA